MRGAQKRNIPVGHAYGMTRWVIFAATLTLLMSGVMKRGE